VTANNTKGKLHNGNGKVAIDIRVIAVNT